MPLFGISSPGSFFSKVKSGVGSFIGGVNRAAGSIGNVANQASNILGTISGIASNPITQSIAGSLGVGDSLAKFASATQAGQNLAQKVGGVSGKVGDITSAGTYFGQGAIPATRNALERAKGIVGDSKDILAGFRDAMNSNMMGRNWASINPFDASGRLRPVLNPTPTQAIGQPLGLTIPRGMM
jgi:hypothetical protein